MTEEIAAARRLDCVLVNVQADGTQPTIVAQATGREVRELGATTVRVGTLRSARVAADTIVDTRVLASKSFACALRGRLCLTAETLSLLKLLVRFMSLLLSGRPLVLL